ncbi:hypothetical protein [Methylocystis parvus]|uniref:hypothetical protein n=1 Tax=Methylocystis parvus TaxID=134 RepID=UPI003C71269A
MQTTKNSFKQKLNYDPIRKRHERRIKQINDIFIETRLSIGGLKRQLLKYEGHKQARIHIAVPSNGGKNANIQRKRSQIIGMLNQKIAHKEFMQSLVFAITVTESYVQDTLCLALTAYPHKLTVSPKGNKSESFCVDVKEIANTESLDNLISELARLRIRDVMYATPKSYMNYMNEVLSFTINDELLDKYIEMKATRDAYIHGDGTCNEIYIKKSGKMARVKVGERLPVDEDYLKNCLACMKEIFTEIYRGMMNHHGDSKKMQRAFDLDPSL